MKGFQSSAPTKWLLLIPCAWLAFGVLGSAQRRAAPPTSPDHAMPRERIAPPARVQCPRNHLTAYNGRVLAYRRNAARTFIRVRTDWDTTEQVTLRHGKRRTPAEWFLLHGETFHDRDWAVIESRRGQVHPGMRANIWVCDDGRNPIVDWQPPAHDAPRASDH